MKIPERVNASWIATLGDDQLVRAEATLHKEFAAQEISEKELKGARYELMRGPESLVGAWLRWLMVSNETRNRGLVVQRRRSS